MTETLVLNKWDTYKPIPGYEGLYLAHGLGHVKSLRFNKIMKAPIAHNGYRTITLCDSESNRRNVPLSWVICGVFNGPRPYGVVCRHLDGNNLNNIAGNLAWGTQKENQEDARRHGTWTHGTMVNTSILTEDEVREIRRMLMSGLSRTQVGEIMGCGYTNVYHIDVGNSWAWLE